MSKQPSRLIPGTAAPVSTFKDTRQCLVQRKKSSHVEKTQSVYELLKCSWGDKVGAKYHNYKTRALITTRHEADTLPQIWLLAKK